MRLIQILFLGFLCIPIFEIYLFIEIGSQIGGFFTIMLIFVTAILGATLIRSQGLKTIQKIKHCSARGELPAIPLLEGVLLLLAGALLLTPGFFTDSLGFLIVVPISRQWLANIILSAGLFRVMSKAGKQTHQDSQESDASNVFQSESATKFSTKRDAHNKSTLEGEFKVDDDSK